MNGTINFLLAGVGGQGTILASDVLVNVGLAAGLAAKQAEITACRSGAVTSSATCAGARPFTPPWPARARWMCCWPSKRSRRCATCTICGPARRS